MNVDNANAFAYVLAKAIAAPAMADPASELDMTRGFAPFPDPDGMNHVGGTSAVWVGGDPTLVCWATAAWAPGGAPRAQVTVTTWPANSGDWAVEVETVGLSDRAIDRKWAFRFAGADAFEIQGRTTYDPTTGNATADDAEAAAYALAGIVGRVVA